MKNLKELFPRGSQSFLEANGQGSQVIEGAIDFEKTPRDTSGMTKTEAEYALILEAMKRRGEILRYEYEGMTLRWNGVKYTPDFVVIKELRIGDQIAFAYQTTFIEVKGAWTKGKYERAVERFRHAKTYWPEFAFELHQKTKDGWRRLY